MSLSVVMPNFNHAKWLPRAIKALVEQSKQADEVIVIDDASTDSSISVIEQIANKYSSIRLIRHQSNLGAAAAMTNGLAAAKGEFVLFAAADDFVLPGMLERASNALREYPEAALFSAGAVVIDPDDNIIDFRPFTEPAQTARYVTPDAVRRLILFSDNWIVGPTVVYRRERLLAIGGFDAALGSFCDGIVVRNLALRHGFYFDPEILAAYMVYRQSFSATSALSETKTQALIDIARERGAQVFPEDVRHYYSELIARRLRFNMSRLSLSFSEGHQNVNGLSNVLGGGAMDRHILRILARIPLVERPAILAWLFLRTRPFGAWSTIKSWWNHKQHDPVRRVLVAPLITKMAGAVNNEEVRN